ncbi:MAG: glycosyltransferase family 2 protein [Gemmataceae bacterium]
MMRLDPDADRRTAAVPLLPGFARTPLPVARRSSRRPVVSVCIPNWNCRDLLRQCLRSLTARRQGVRLEVIVVDNASSDGAADLVAAEFPRVRLIRNPANRGYARACNQAARLARGRYLFFLNNDTVLPRHALGRLCAYARANPHIGLLGPRLRDGAGKVQHSARAMPRVPALLHRLAILRWTGLFRSAYRRYRGRETDAETTRSVEVLMGAAVLMPRRVWRRIGGWDEGYAFGGEDIDLCARVSGARQAVVYHPAVEITHFGRVSSRQLTGFVHASTLIGITRSLRQTGTRSAALFAYKLAFTLDLPFRALALGGQYLQARIRGRSEAAERAWQDLVGLGYLLRHGMSGFWRA